MIYNIMTCGVGGQGLMLVSNIIGQTCARLGINIRTAETHGLAQRSGSIYTHIRIGDDVYSPLIPYGEADLLLAMEAIESLRYIEFLKLKGEIILSDYIWQPVSATFNRVVSEESKYLEVDQIVNQLRKVTDNISLVNALKLAYEAGNPLTSNIVLLGALSKTKGFPLSTEELKKSIPLVVPKKAIEVNIRAFDIGYNSK